MRFGVFIFCLGAMTASGQTKVSIGLDAPKGIGIEIEHKINLNNALFVGFKRGSLQTVFSQENNYSEADVFLPFLQLQIGYRYFITPKFFVSGYAQPSLRMKYYSNPEYSDADLFVDEVINNSSDFYLDFGVEARYYVLPFLQLGGGVRNKYSKLVDIPSSTSPVKIESFGNYVINVYFTTNRLKSKKI